MPRLDVARRCWSWRTGCAIAAWPAWSPSCRGASASPPRAGYSLPPRRRVVSIWLPHWPTDRRRKALGPDAPPRDVPLITALHDGNRRVIDAACSAAAALGLRPGMAVAQAMAVVPGLHVLEADPADDA